LKSQESYLQDPGHAMLAKYLQNLLAMSLGSERRVLFDINEEGNEDFVLRLLITSFISFHASCFVIVFCSFKFVLIICFLSNPNQMSKLVFVFLVLSFFVRTL
jgi:hypothetical protein